MQDYPLNKLEFVLVDDRSLDTTRSILQEFAKQSKNIKVISIQNLSPDLAPKKNAIDKAIAVAEGEIILLSDADGRPGPSWVRAMTSYFKENVGMVIGYAPYTTDKTNQHIFYKLLALEYLSHAAVAAASTGIGYPLTCVGTNLAYRKEVYDQLNGFGKHKKFASGDDDLFLQRVRDETNWHIRYANIRESQVENAPPTSWSQFYQQRLRYASKGFMYPWKVSLALMAFYLLNLLFIILAIGLIFNIETLFILIAGLCLKGFIEYIFLEKGASYLTDRRFLYLFTIAFILHIPYVVVFGLLTQLQKFQWAGIKSQNMIIPPVNK
jgi:cellulose synthase/poly-beta-1,6-N-acetylglucosamine synthase-like glycosyltransferase